MSKLQTDPGPRLVLIHDARGLALEPLSGADLAYLVRETWRIGGRGLDWPAWAGAILPSGRPVTRELWAGYTALLVQAHLARRLPIAGAAWELLASHGEALQRAMAYAQRASGAGRKP